MARIYKEVVEDGKPVKRWVEEYISFDFDKEGNIITDNSKYEDKIDEYDENGNINLLPWCFSDEYSDYEEENEDESRDSEPIFISQNYFAGINKQTKKIGDWVLQDNGYLVWNTDNNNISVSVRLFDVFIRDFFSEEIKKKFDDYNNLIYLRNGDYRYFFEYDEKKLIHLKVIDLPIEECFEKWFEYDGGKVVHEIDSDDDELYFDYDEEGRLVSIITSYVQESNQERKFEYDVNGNLLHEIETKEDSIIYESKYKYDSNNNLISRITVNDDSSMHEVKYEYDSYGKITFAQQDDYITEWDSSGNIIYEKNEYGEYEFEFNSEGKLIHSIHNIPKNEERRNDNFYNINSTCSRDKNYEKRWNNSGKLIYCRYSDEKKIYEYNKNNELIHYMKETKDDEKESKFEAWYEYNNGKIVYKKNSDGKEYRYNIQGKLIYHRDSYGDTYWTECDSYGNIIHLKTDDFEEWYEYEFYDNGNIKKKICYRRR